MRGSVWLLGVSGVLAGCAGSRPTGSPLTRADFDTTELIAYRTLTRDDFRAPMAMGFSVTEEQRLGATTCAKIAMRPEDIVTRAQRASTGDTVYAASLDDPIFFAVFSRKCSWWNPKQSRTEEDILEHEQVHFAIVEIEARRLNGRVGNIVERVRTVGTDLGTVRRTAYKELSALLQESEETRHGRDELYDSQVWPVDRVRQRQWSLKVTGELESTQAFARGPQRSGSTPVAIALEPAPPSPAAPPPLAPAATPPAATPPAPAPSAPATPASSTAGFPD